MRIFVCVCVWEEEQLKEDLFIDQKKNDNSSEDNTRCQSQVGIVKFKKFFSGEKFAMSVDKQWQNQLRIPHH